MGLLWLIGLSSIAFGAAAAEPKVEIDANTKIEKDKPISERKPQEREPQDASKGGTRPER